MIRTKILTGLAALLLITAAYSPAIANAMHRGTVLEAATAGGYSYLYIDEGGKQFWIAGPAAEAKKGETVIFDEQMWMTNFTSKAYNRTFDRILFVGTIGPDTGALAPAAAMPKAPESSSASGANSAKKETIGSLISNKAELTGKSIEVRGKVVKVSKNIMAHSWVHIEDGTFHEGVNKVIFRTRGGTPPVGEEVTAIGRLETDVDFGMGYFYEVIVEDASFTK